jgi:hypothetical protein
MSALQLVDGLVSVLLAWAITELLFTWWPKP